MKRKLLPLITPASTENFHKRSIKSDECWKWIGAKDKDGYGRISLSKNITVLAHRFSYALHKGVDPAEFCICHRCDNPECTNPSHLFIATHKENNIDKVSKGRNLPHIFVGERNPRAKLTEQDISEIKRLSLCGKTNTEIGRTFGVHHSTISAIKLGKIWHKYATSKK
jgi:hypothetical protein